MPTAPLPGATTGVHTNIAQRQYWRNQSASRLIATSPNLTDLVSLHTPTHPNACFCSVHLATEPYGLHMLYLYAPRSSAFAERIRGVGHHCTQCNGVAINRQTD